MPTVYVTHCPNPRISIDEAGDFGKVVQVFKNTDRANGDTQIYLDHAREIMANVSDQDFVLPLGDTVLSHIVSGIQAEKTGLINALVWDNRAGRYFAKVVDFEAQPR